GLGIAWTQVTAKVTRRSTWDRCAVNEHHSKDLVDTTRRNRYRAEASQQTHSEADSDTIVAAGHQAAADVDARACRPPESGNGRKPDARGGSDRGSSAGGSVAGAGEARRRSGRQGRYLGRPGLRVLLRRLPRRRLPSACA